MSSPKKIAFIIGGGPRIGLSVAHAFKAQGYISIIGRRIPDHDALKAQGLYGCALDVTSPKSIAAAFRQIRENNDAAGPSGIPSVVVYNAAALTMAGGNDDGTGVFGLAVESYRRDLNVNLVGAYAALHETVRGWRELGNDGNTEVKKAFIATGNVVPWKPVPEAMTLGSGKAALAHLVETGMLSKECQENGWRFYFVSQVTRDGGPVPYDQVDGDRHGSEYIRAVEQGGKDWKVSFVA